MTKILRGPGNPAGWKLEELLPALVAEIKEKCDHVANDKHRVARAIISGSMQTVHFLRAAEAKQKELRALLDTIAPDGDKPRIGPGSPGYDDRAIFDKKAHDAHLARRKPKMGVRQERPHGA